MTRNTPNTNDSAPIGGRRRAGVAAGLGAGLLGGAIGGFVLGVPGLTSAANDDLSTTAAAIVQQSDETGTDDTDTDTDDTDTDTDDTGTDTTDRAGDRLARATEELRATLQELVDDGTIDAAQADAVTDHLIADRGERQAERAERRAERQAEREQRADELAATLGITADELQEELRAGNSLADIAEANGVDVQVVIDQLVASATDRIDDAVENGRIDADEAAEKAEQLEERITDRVNGEGPERPGRGGGPGDGFRGRGGFGR